MLPVKLNVEGKAIVFTKNFQVPEKCCQGINWSASVHCTSLGFSILSLFLSDSSLQCSRDLSASRISSSPIGQSPNDVITMCGRTVSCLIHELYLTNHHSSQEHATYGTSCLLLAFLNLTTCHLSNLRSINLILSLYPLSCSLSSFFLCWGFL